MRLTRLEARSLLHTQPAGNSIDWRVPFPGASVGLNPFQVAQIASAPSQELVKSQGLHCNSEICGKKSFLLLFTLVGLVNLVRDFLKLFLSRLPSCLRGFHARWNVSIYIPYNCVVWLVLCTVYSDADSYAQTSVYSVDHGMVKHLWSQCHVRIVLSSLTDQ